MSGIQRIFYYTSARLLSLGLGHLQLPISKLFDLRIADTTLVWKNMLF